MDKAASSREPVGMALLYCLAIFVSSSLLFLIQPMCAKAVLPYLGGTPAVWNTCMVFFQAGLLAGYAYAHYLPGRLGLLRHGVLHVLLLLAALFLLPIFFPTEPYIPWYPVLWLLLLLVQLVALPFVLVSSSGPLLQRWFAVASRGRDPYFLYAASNLGSFTALLSYPVLVEPNLTLSQQGWLWAGGFLLLIGLTTVCIPWRAGEFTQTTLSAPAATRPGWTERGRWIMLALIPSSLLLSVTSHLTMDIAPVPLLWVVPLALYLLTFTLVFMTRPLIPHALVQRWTPLVLVVLTLVLLSEAADPVLLVLGIHLGGFFWLALACHGELARTRPPAAFLTEFYLCLAIGGALGGVFTAVLAPLIFPGLVEYPLMLVLVALFWKPQPWDWPSKSELLWPALVGLLALLAIATPFARILYALPLLLIFLLQERPLRFALGFAALFLVASLHQGEHGTLIYRERSYFGVHRVTQVGHLRRLVHGSTVHGQQSLLPSARREPLTYYHRHSPIGRIFKALEDDPRRQRVGLVGLGTGSLAAYARPGEDWTFYEIDPAVIRIATNPQLFTYLSDSPADLRVIEGDARLQLRRTEERYGLLVIDAFGSDAIPLHLLTRQALERYLDRLDEDGLLAFHISNRYLDLEPVLAALAADADPPLVCLVLDQEVTPLERDQGSMRSIWAVLARRAEDLPAPLRPPLWQPAHTRADLRPWTDDFSNVFRVFRLD